MSILLALAAGAAALGFLVHTFVGSRYVVAPHLAARHVPPVSRWLMFLCWHAVTLCLAAMTAFLIWAALNPVPAREAVAALTALNASIAALCLYVCLRGGLPLHKIPPMWLFPVLTVLGVAGLSS